MVNRKYRNMPLTHSYEIFRECFLVVTIATRRRDEFFFFQCSHLGLFEIYISVLFLAKV